MLEWDALVIGTPQDPQWNWRISHDGEILPGTNYRTEALRSAHRWIEDDPTVAKEFAENVMNDIYGAGFLTTLTVTDIADFLIDWSTTPF